MIPHTRPGTWPQKIPPTRFASRIRRDDAENCRVALLGMPDDTGVRLNGGRAGAAEGPTAFRHALGAYGAASPPTTTAWPGVYDAGDVEPADDLGETHRRVSEASAALIDQGLFPIGIGGGHDLTFAFVRGVVSRVGPLAGVYFDAHLDVRKEPGSGMPFRRLIEGGHATDLVVHGLDSMANSADHMHWFNAHHGRAEPFDPMLWPSADMFVSLDLDVVDQAHAPGVSARNPVGVSAREIEDWVRRTGREPRVRCFDIMELSPLNDEPNDREGRTARLAARLFLTFLRAFAERGA